MTPRVFDSPILRNPITWRFHWDIVFLFEIDVVDVRLRLPKGAFLAEIRPGVGLVGVSVELGSAGNLGGRLPAFTEINWCVALETDLSRAMPTPRFCMFTGKVGGDCPAFLDHCAAVDKLPIYRSERLRADVRMEEQAVSVEDERGPILSLRSTHRRPPVYEARTHWVQLASAEPGGPWFQGLSWTGEVYEHQQGHRGGVIHPHPFFEGIDVRGLGDRCYLQMLCRPDHPIEVDFYEPLPARR